MTDLPLLLSVNATAEALGIGRSKCYELILRGELRSLTIGSRRLVPRRAIEDYIAEALQQIENEEKVIP